MGVYRTVFPCIIAEDNNVPQHKYKQINTDLGLFIYDIDLEIEILSGVKYINNTICRIVMTFDDNDEITEKCYIIDFDEQKLNDFKQYADDNMYKVHYIDMLSSTLEGRIITEYKFVE